MGYFIKKNKTFIANKLAKVSESLIKDINIDQEKQDTIVEDTVIIHEKREIKKSVVSISKQNIVNTGKSNPIEVEVYKPVKNENKITVKKGSVVVNKSIKNKNTIEFFKAAEPDNTKDWENGFKDINEGYVFNIDSLNDDFLKFSGFNEEFIGFLEHKELYLKVFDQVKNIKTDKKIPKVVHLCYGFKGDVEFEFFNYLCVLSIVNRIKPDKILLYHHYDIKGKWWDRAKIHLTTVRTNLVTNFEDKPITHFAHMSDVIRLEMLRFAGGIYMDIDTFVNKSFDDLLDNQFVMGIQNSGGKEERDYYGLCNAIMLSEKQSKFSTEWIKSYNSFDKDKWDYHSVVKPYYLAKDMLNNITILPPKKFFPFLWNETYDYLFTDNSLALNELKESYSMHLWETIEKPHLLKIDYDLIFNQNNNLNYLFKDYLVNNKDATVSFIFLTHNRPEKTIDYIDTYIQSLSRNDVKEIIIYDNGSQDTELLGYLNRINTIEKVKVIFGPENIGVAGGRDVLFKHVTGDIVFSVDSDSKLIDQSFIDDAKEILNDRDIWVCGTVGAFFKSWDHGTHEDVNDDSSYEGEVDTLAGCCQIFRKDILNDIWVDLDFAPFWYEDTDFCFQAKDKGGKIFRFHFNNKFYHVWGGSGNTIFGNNLFKEKHKIMIKKWKNKIKLKYIG